MPSISSSASTTSSVHPFFSNPSTKSSSFRAEIFTRRWRLLDLPKMGSLYSSPHLSLWIRCSGVVLMPPVIVVLIIICSTPCSSLLWRTRSVVDANDMVLRRSQPMPWRARTSSNGSDKRLFYDTWAIFETSVNIIKHTRVHPPSRLLRFLVGGAAMLNRGTKITEWDNTSIGHQHQYDMHNTLTFDFKYSPNYLLLSQ